MYVRQYLFLESRNGLLYHSISSTKKKGKMAGGELKSRKVAALLSGLTSISVCL